MNAPRPEDIRLRDSSTVLLEASAGTGKTWQMANMVLRLVTEESLPIDKLLVITFTDAATAELRDRVRKRLIEARIVLEKAVEGDSSDNVDTSLDRLCRDNPKEHLGRIVKALRRFDTLPVSTIHGFCQRTLTQLAFEAGQDTDLEVVTGPDEVIEQIVHDRLMALYLEQSPEAVRQLTALGADEKTLTQLAKWACEADAPAFVPPAAEETQRVVAHLSRLNELDEAFIAWWTGPDAEQQRKMFEQFGGFKDNSVFSPTKVPNIWTAITAWCEQPGANLDTRAGPSWLRFERDEVQRGIKKTWKGPPFAAWDLVDRVKAFRDERLGLLSQLRPSVLGSFAATVRDEVQRELTRRGLLTFDGMLSRLAEQLNETGPDGALAKAMRARYDAALVDEFQDTDAAQWAILKTVFYGKKRLILVGDPKQSIYRFRGADVNTYLGVQKAVREGSNGAVLPMDTNWRSDGPLIDGLNHLFADDSGEAPVFGYRGVRYVSVKAHNQDARWRSSAQVQGRERRPVELRWVPDGLSDDAKTRGLTKARARPLLAEASAEEAATILTSNTELERGNGSKSRVEPGDIAILVYEHADASAVRVALRKRGIPSVAVDKRSVFESDAARWVNAWLDAVASPGSESRARMAVVNPLFGWTPRKLAEAMDAKSGSPEANAWETWLVELKTDAERWPRQGFARVFEGALRRADAMNGLLGSLDGERHATDVRHLVELLHAEERRSHVGPRGLAAWARARRDEKSEAEERKMRLETDANAVKVATVWASKGLEFPIVLVPFPGVRTAKSDDRNTLVRFHDADSGRRTIDLRVKDHPERSESVKRSLLEAEKEEMRLIYVALTRAKHHVVVWLPHMQKYGARSLIEDKAIGRVVFRPGASPSDFKTPGDYMNVLQELADKSEGTIGWSIQEPTGIFKQILLREDAAAQLRAAMWNQEENRYFGRGWQVTSFSGMVTGKQLEDHEPAREEIERGKQALDKGTGVAGLPQSDDQQAVDATLEDDEPTAVDSTSIASETGVLSDVPPGFENLQGGTEPGKWIHEVFELLDFGTGEAHDGRSLEELVRDTALRYGIRDEGQHKIVTESVPHVLQTPLDGGATKLPAGFCLANLSNADRLNELAFDLGLGDGADWRPEGGKRLNAEQAVDAIRKRKELDSKWIGNSWIEHVTGPKVDSHGKQVPAKVLPATAGILTGFIDLTFVAKDKDGNVRYFLADYKTNAIGPRGRRWTSRLGNYTQPWLAWEMNLHAYHLQSLLYTIALHRFLRTRLDQYDYDRDIGGYLYLFVRGMHPGRDGQAYHRDSGLALGVWSDKWPKQVVEQLDEALKGEDKEATTTVEGTAGQEVMR